MPDPALATRWTALRLEADLAGAARGHRDDAYLAESRARVEAMAGQVERIAAMLRLPPGIARRRDRADARPGNGGLPGRRWARFDDRDDPADWDTVAEAFDGIGRPYSAACRYRSAAATLRTRGPRADAATTLAGARSTAAGLGAAPLLDAIDLLARQARLEITDGATAADAAPPSDLTERELEVLRLIAAGWSNQQIADALFISRKTASVHASHIFDKLGAANRIDAAAIARRLGVEAGPPPPGGRP